MHVSFTNQDVIHLSVAPGSKSWGIFVGVMSMGLGASYYSPDEHFLIKIAYLVGCLVLGLTFLDDWEDCVFDSGKGQITMTRRNWLDWLTSRCATHNTLVLDTNAVIAVNVVKAASKSLREGYQIALVLRAGGTVPILETTAGHRSEQELVARRLRVFLCLERVETVGSSGPDWMESEDDDLPSLEVESLKGSGNINFDDVKVDDGAAVMDDDSDSSSNASAMFDEF